MRLRVALEDMGETAPNTLLARDESREILLSLPRAWCNASKFRSRAQNRVSLDQTRTTVLFLPSVRVFCSTSPMVSVTQSSRWLRALWLRSIVGPAVSTGMAFAGDHRVTATLA